MKRLVLFILTLVLGGILASAERGMAAQLRYVFTPGSKYAYDCRLDGDFKLSMEAGGQTQALSAKLTGFAGVLLNIEGVTPGNTASMEVLLDKVSGGFSFMGNETPLPAELADKITKAINPTLLDMDTMGRVVSLKMPSLEKILKDMAKSEANPASGMPPLPADPMGELNRQLANMSPALPEGDLQPGDTWEVTAKSSMPGGADFTVTTHNTFRGLTTLNGKDCYLLESSTEVPLNKLPLPAVVPGGTGMKGSFTIKGLSWHEAGNMMLLRMEINGLVRMGAVIEGGAANIEARLKMQMDRR